MANIVGVPTVMRPQPDTEGKASTSLENHEVQRREGRTTQPRFRGRFVKRRNERKERHDQFFNANREPSTGRFLPKDWPKGLFYVPISKNLLANMESDVWADLAKISVEKHLSGQDFKKAVWYHKQGILPDRVPDRFKQKYINALKEPSFQSRLEEATVQFSTYDSASMPNMLESDDEVSDLPTESDEFALQVVNVVSGFYLGAQININDLCQKLPKAKRKAFNEIFEPPKINIRLRKPAATVSIYASGKVLTMGTKSPDESFDASRKVAEMVKNIQGTKLKNYRVLNITCTSKLPFQITLKNFAQRYEEIATYEPELCNTVDCRLDEYDCFVKIHKTGSLILIGKDLLNIELAKEYIKSLAEAVHT